MILKENYAYVHVGTLVSMSIEYIRYNDIKISVRVQMIIVVDKWPYSLMFVLIVELTLINLILALSWLDHFKA